MAGKFKVVVSDLHLGAGFAQEGNALEDFTEDAEFAGLLEALREESDAQGLECELIVAGDMMKTCTGGPYRSGSERQLKPRANGL